MYISRAEIPRNLAEATEIMLEILQGFILRRVREAVEVEVTLEFYDVMVSSVSYIIWSSYIVVPVAASRLWHS